MKKLYPFVSVVLVLFSAFFLWVLPAQAKGIILGDQIPQGKTVDSNAILFGEKIQLDGDVEGDVLAIGTQVIVNGNINGSLIVLGQDAQINGNVNGTVYSAGQKTFLNDKATLLNDLYFLGLNLTTKPESKIGRDLLLVTLGSTLAGEVGRDTHGLNGPVPIIQAIYELFGRSLPGVEGGDLTGWNFDMKNSPLVQNSILVGNKGMDGVNWKTAGLAILGLNGVTSLDYLDQAGAIDTGLLGKWFLQKLRLLINVLVYSIIAMLVFPKFFHQTGEMIWQKPVRSSGIGLLAVIFIFTATILIAAILVPIILFFSKLTLHSFAIFTAIIGYTSLTLAGAAIYIFSVFVTKGIAGGILFEKLFGRFAPKAANYRFLTLFLGAVVYVLLRSIPYLGILFGIWLSIIGLGAAWMVWSEGRKASETIA